MALNNKLIKQRLKSIHSTKKITKAMELVAAAKMRKAVNSALSTRAYAALAKMMLSRLSEMKKLGHHPLLQVRPVKRILIVLVTPHRGLCGGLNANIFKKVLEQVKNPGQLGIQRQGSKKILPPAGHTPEISAITIGRKGERMLKKLNVKIVASFNDLADNPKIFEIYPIARMIVNEFTQKHYDRVAIFYTDFVSSLSQKPAIKQLLPISPYDLEKMLKSLGSNTAEPATASDSTEDVPTSGVGKEKVENVDFIFEPDPVQIMDVMLPRLMETQIFQAILESTASEQSARMMAMRSASDAAGDMIDDLTFMLNQSRQAGITREIAEISGGAAALE
jgi:F-type H+-transporting ATPase subunit gamma